MGYDEMTVSADIDHIDEIKAFVKNKLDRTDCTKETLNDIFIAIDELYGNISQYAYGDGEGDVTVGFEADPEGRVVRICLIDSGPRFDPMQGVEPDTSLPGNMREMGGLGLFLVKKLMDDISYEYKDGKNHVWICKKLS